MIVGMDFGTTNSGMALVEDGKVRLLPLDSANVNPHVLRTALYITNQQSITIGRTAVDAYYEQNIGRPIKLKEVWVGEVEVYGADMFFVQDLYVWMDIFSPGRLFLSLKSALRDPNYAGTVIAQFFYRLEDLIALFLAATRHRASQLLGVDVRRLALGRPVRFSFDPAEDTLAQSRLLRAAFQAGYEEVYFEYEPVAAASHFESTLSQPQNVLVFDFGGGTLDITIARLGGGDRQTLATGGIPIAGDIFDQRISRAKLPQHFGEGSIFGGREKPLPVPASLYDGFSDWQKLLELQKPEHIHRLSEIADSSRVPSQIKAFQSLIASNYGLRIFDQVELAKRKLSEKVGATIKLEGEGFKVFEMVTRSEFEQIIRREAEQIANHLDDTLRQSGLNAGQIDAVIRTGGSSEIPLFQSLLIERFGREKVQAVDTFSSVTAGLGLIARQIETGEIMKRAYTTDDLSPSRSVDLEQQAPSVSMPLLLSRVKAAERLDAGIPAFDPAQPALILFAPPFNVRVLPWQTDEITLKEANWTAETPPKTGLIAPFKHRLLLLTTHYRFLLVTPHQLFDLAAANAGIRDLFHFLPEEQIYVIADWETLKSKPRLVIPTTLGYARAYHTSALIEQIEAPIPYQFDDPLDGWALTLLGAESSDELALAAKNGRATRIAISALPNVGGLVYNRKNKERMAGASLIDLNKPLLLVTRDGYARLAPPNSIPVTPRLNQQGKSILARDHLVGLLPASPQHLVYAITHQRIFSIDTEQLPADNSTRSVKIAEIKENERIVGIFAIEKSQVAS